MLIGGLAGFESSSAAVWKGNLKETQTPAKAVLRRRVDDKLCGGEGGQKLVQLRRSGYHRGGLTRVEISTDGGGE